MNEMDKELLKRLHDKYVKGIDPNKNNGGNGEMNKEIVEGLGKVKEAVEGLKAREPYKYEKQLDQFLGMNHREHAEFRKNNAELYEKMFPSEKVEMPKPNNYDLYRELIMKNPADSHKLPYNMRLWASMNDKEFTDLLYVAETSKMAEQTAGSQNPVYKKLKEMETQEGQA